MKRLIMFAGLPGSGKSTICRCMSKESGVCHVDVDHYKEHRTDSQKVTEEIDPPELRMLYCGDALKEAFCHFEAGASTVVMDDVYPYHCVRAELEARCARQNIQVSWVEVRSSHKTAVRRLTIPRLGHILTPEKATNIHRMCVEVFEEFPINHPNHVIIYNEEGDKIDVLVSEVLELTR